MVFSPWCGVITDTVFGLQCWFDVRVIPRLLFYSINSDQLLRVAGFIGHTHNVLCRGHISNQIRGWRPGGLHLFERSVAAIPIIESGCLV